MKFRRVVPVVLILAAASAARPLHAQILGPDMRDRLADWFRTSQRVAPGQWGIAIADQDGRLLYGVEPRQMLVPASTVKLFTTGFARTVLGSDARRNTRVLGRGTLDPVTGAWEGSWSLEVNGDPSLENPTGDGPRLADLARQLADRGIRQLQGPLSVVSMDGVQADAEYPSAWSPRHWGRLFAPLIGPLTLHENMVSFTIRPATRVGGAPEIVIDEPAGVRNLVTVRARTVAGSRSRLHLQSRDDGGWIVSGTIGSRARTQYFAAVASNPKAVLARAWAAALEQAGIAWVHTDPEDAAPVDSEPYVLAEVASPVFDSVASDVNRRSLNLGAELLLQWAAGRTGGPALLTRHVVEVTGDSSVHLVDGSGLSGEDRASPMAFVRYLAKLPLTEGGRNFPLLLPANGVGTLKRLSTGLPERGVVRAKTGTLRDVSAVTGYLGRPDGVLIISLMYNGRKTYNARQQQWRLFRLLGADGVAIPRDTLVPDDMQYGSVDETAPGAVSD